MPNAFRVFLTALCLSRGQAILIEGSIVRKQGNRRSHSFNPRQNVVVVPFHSSNHRHFAEPNDNNSNSKNNKMNMAALERDVIESTKARLDLKRVLDTTPQQDQDPHNIIFSRHGVSWKISLAAALGVGTVTYLAFHNIIVAGLIAIATAVAAMGDPLEEDSIAGALARVVGRWTLQSVDVTQNKVRAMARVIVMGEEEISLLKRQLNDMEQEVSELRRWKQIRLAVDEALPRFALDDLKEIARANRIAVGGTKTQLLTRLVETGIIDL